MNQEDALKILNKERDYEEKISKDIIYFLEISLPSIKGLSKEELEEIDDKLKIIEKDSIRHMNMFEKLIDFVLENGKGKY